MNDIKNEEKFSAMNQIKSISANNTLYRVDKKELESDKFNKIMTIINKLDNKVADTYHVYDSILVPWKLKNSSNI